MNEQLLHMMCNGGMVARAFWILCPTWEPLKGGPVMTYQPVFRLAVTKTCTPMMTATAKGLVSPVVMVADNSGWRGPVGRHVRAKHFQGGILSEAGYAIKTSMCSRNSEVESQPLQFTSTGQHVVCRHLTCSRAKKVMNPAAFEGIGGNFAYALIETDAHVNPATYESTSILQG